MYMARLELPKPSGLACREYVAALQASISMASTEPMRFEKNLHPSISSFTLSCTEHSLPFAMLCVLAGHP